MLRKWKRQWVRQMKKIAAPTMIAGMILISSYSTALAAPTGGVITSGAGLITTGGPATTITQNTNKLAVNWNSFSIGAGEKVTFVQPSANSIALNRVVGSEASKIYGSLSANGQVFLVNPSGVLFAPGSQVNVGGLVASTQNITDKNFQDGKYTFSGGGAAGLVVNQGNITAADGGYVALLGTQARNEGVIVAQKGTVALAGGNATTLDIGNGLVSIVVDEAAISALAENKKLIQADGGQVILTASAANSLAGSVVNNSGIIRARSLSSANGVIRLGGSGPTQNSGTLDVSGTSAGLSGGTILIGGSQVTVKEGSTIDASGNTRGGTIVIGESYSGAGPIAQTITIDKGVVIKADASLAGSGGLITVSAGDKSSVAGALSATGRLGGTIKVLGNTVAITGKSTIDTSGDLGGGTILIGGNYQGKGPEKNATATLIEKTAMIKADANTAGDGGKVVVWSDDQTSFQGVISATGGKERGNGGTVEVSGKKTLDYKGTVDLKAANGKTGDLLLDPTDYTIAASGGDLTGAALAAQLESANVTILSSDGATGTGGDIVVDDAVSWNAGNSLTFNAYRNVLIKKAITAGTNANVVVRADETGTGNGTVSFTGLGAIAVNGTGTSTIYYNPSSYATPTAFGANGTGYMLVNTAANLQDVSTNVAGKYALSKDLDASAIVLTPIANFSGTFDGMNKEITGLKVSGADNTGMFGSITSTGLVQNIGVTNATITATGTTTGLVGNPVYVGVVVGVNSGTIKNVYSSGTLEGTGANGINSGSSGSVYAGGIAGKNTGNIMKSYNSGLSITAYGGSSSTAAAPGHGGSIYAGGISGYNTGEIRASYGSGLSIYARSGNGGVQYGANGGSGGSGGSVYIAGLTPYNTGTILNSYNRGTVTSSGNAGNGGSANTNEGCYGGVGGSVTAGGLVATNNGTITNSYHVGAISNSVTVGAGARGSYGGMAANGTLTNGALVGLQTTGTTTNSYWDKTVSNVLTSAAGAGMTTAQMSNSINYSGWNFSSVWKIGDSGYPEFFTKIMLLIRAADAEMVYSGNTFASGYSVTYNGFVDGDTASVLGGSLSFDGAAATARNAGTYSIVPSGYSSDKYDFSYVAGTLTIVPKTLTASLTGSVTKTYDGTTAAALTAGNYTLAGVVGTDAVSLNNPAVGAFANKNVGTGKTVTASGLALTGAAAANYTVNASASAAIGVVDPATLTATLAGTIEKTYDGNQAAALQNANYSFAGIIGADSVTATGSGTFADKNAGAGKIITATSTTLGGTDGGNYVLAAQPAAAAIGKINPKELTVTAVTDTKTYDGTMTSTAAPTVVGLVAGDTATASQTFASKNAGSGIALTATALITDGNGGANYSVTANAATGTIEQRVLSILATAADKIYDGTTAATISGITVGNVVAGETISATYSGGAFADKNAGAGKAVTVNGLAFTAGAATDAANYALPGAVSSSATIQKAALSVTAVTDTKTYDGTVVSTAAPTVVGLVAGDAATASQTFASKNAGTGIALTPTVAITDGNGGGNYVVTTNINTGAIDPATLTATLAGTIEKTYDGTTAAALQNANYSFAGIIGADTVTATGSGTFADKNAGAGKIITVTGTTLGGTDGGNYVLAAQPAAAAIGRINQAALSITASVDTKTYDGTVVSIAAPTVVGLVAGDTLTASQEFADKNAGTGKTLQVNGYTVTDGNGGANYAITTHSSAAGTIDKRALTATASVTDKVYDGTTAATISGITVGNVVAGETVSATYTGGQFADKNAGANKVVAINGLAVTAGAGTDLNNYVAPAAASSAASITPATLVVSAVTDSKTYDGTTTSNAAPTVSGLVAGDTVSGLSQTFADKNAGSNKTITASGYSISDGNGGANYTVNKVTALGTINAKELTASLTGNVTKTYDGTNAAALTDGNFALGGLVAGDRVGVNNMTTGAYDSKDAGQGKTVFASGLTLSGLDAGNYTVNTNVSGAVGIINPASLVISAKDLVKSFDGSTFSGGNGVNYYGLVAGETSAVLGGALVYSGTSQGAREVGNYSIAPGGYRSNNYAISYQNGLLDITAAPQNSVGVSTIIALAQQQQSSGLSGTSGTSKTSANSGGTGKDEENPSIETEASQKGSTTSMSNGDLFLTIEGTGVNLGILGPKIVGSGARVQ